jgi:branched-subunit amino acid aminotransferase/4-amino-4-deoxychorismate lyase
MDTNATTVWEITSPGKLTELRLSDLSSLDAVTRQLPDGFYSTFRTYGEGRRVVGLSAHLARLYAPASGLGLQPACTATELRRVMDSLLGEVRPQEARVRIALDSRRGRVFLAIQPLTLLPPDVYNRGIRVVTIHNKKRSSPTLKSTTFINESQKERAALAQETAFEGLLTYRGRILEGMTSNFFYIWSGTLGTAGRGVLRGVTRAEILRIARKELALPVRYRALRVEEIPAIQEAFICSSSRGVVPVVQVDRARIGSGEVGQVTGSLMRAYERDVLLRAEAIV